MREIGLQNDHSRKLVSNEKPHVFISIPSFDQLPAPTCFDQQRFAALKSRTTATLNYGTGRSKSFRRVYLALISAFYILN